MTWMNGLYSINRQVGRCILCMLPGGSANSRMLACLAARNTSVKLLSG